MTPTIAEQARAKLDAMRQDRLIVADAHLRHIVAETGLDLEVRGVPSPTYLEWTVGPLTARLDGNLDAMAFDVAGAGWFADSRGLLRILARQEERA